MDSLFHNTGNGGLFIMLKTLGETISLIESGKLLHISASVQLLKRLPQGNWIGGSTEFFITPGGGLSSDDLLEVFVLPFDEYKICEYDKKSIINLAPDSFDNGFSIMIIPSNSELYRYFSLNAPCLIGTYRKNIVGWVSGAASIYSNSKTLPITVNGQAESYDNYYYDKAVVMHISLPLEKTAKIGIVNIFTHAENSPAINFKTDGFYVTDCLIDGKDCNLAEYLQEKNISTKLPLIGEHLGTDVNVAMKEINDGVVSFHAPVFKDTLYYFANEVDDYAKAFQQRTEKYRGRNIIFNCNCILNYFNGDLENKDLDVFYGPVCYGEITDRILNQTLVYLEVI